MSVHAGGRWNRERLWQIVTVALLLVILAGAMYVRQWQLTPAERGIDYAPDTDEGAYAFSAQLMLQGELPYRDFFATLPPAGLYLFAAVLGLFYHVWGSLEGFMALRYASALYGVATVLVVYFIGRRLGGRPAGLLAAAVLAIDGIVIFQDRRAMLEAPMNLLSALAVLAYLEATLRERSSRWGLVAAGALSGVAAMTKSPGAVVPILLVGMTVLRRRWNDLGPLIAGGITIGLVLAGPFLILCPEQFLKQVYLFQLVRPPDGVLSVGERLSEIWGYPYSWLTLRLCWLGAPVALWSRWREREWAGWLMIVLWVAGTLGLIVLSRSYWGTYYPQLAAPLALLAGGILVRNDGPATDWRERALRQGVPIAILLAFSVWGIGSGHFKVQYGATKVLLSFSKPAFGKIARYLDAHSDPGDMVLATDPLYGMLASRELARGDGRPYMPDSYGGMLYQNLGMADMTWAEMGSLKERIDSDPMDGDQLTTLLFHQPPAQTDVLAAFERASYVIIDHRARRQWSPNVVQWIEARARPVLAVDDVALLERVEGRME